MNSLRERFYEDSRALNWSGPQIEDHWQEITHHYGATGRHYHNLDHLSNLFALQDEYKERLRDFQVVSWAIWYHDVIYNAKRKDNEQQSAQVAQRRLSNTLLSSEKIKKTAQYIEATAHHLSVEAEDDLAYFLDFDLAILGTERAVYQDYAEAVRQEYRHVPGFCYRRGRKKVLRYFAEVEQLFRTPELRERFEAKARENLEWELGGMV